MKSPVTVLGKTGMANEGKPYCHFPERCQTTKAIPKPQDIRGEGQLRNQVLPPSKDRIPSPTSPTRNYLPSLSVLQRWDTRCHIRQFISCSDTPDSQKVLPPIDSQDGSWLAAQGSLTSDPASLRHPPRVPAYWSFFSGLQDCYWSVPCTDWPVFVPCEVF